MSRPKIASAAIFASAAVGATFTPPAFPRPPTFDLSFHDRETTDFLGGRVSFLGGVRNDAG